MALEYADTQKSTSPDNVPVTATRNVLWLTASAIVLLVAMAVVALITVPHELSASRETHTEVQRIREALNELQLVLSALQDAETGERGFLITGNTEFLEPFYAAERSLEGQFTRLQGLIEDGHAQALRGELAALARDQLVYLRQVVELRKAGDPTSAQSLVEKEVGKLRMDAIRQLVQELRTHEEALLSSRLALFQERSQRTETFVRISMLVAIVLAAIAAMLLFRHDRRRVEAERAASTAFELLRSTMDNLSQGVVVFNAQQQLMAWNTRYVELRGVDPTQIAKHMSFASIVQHSVPLALALPTGGAATKTIELSRAQLREPFDAEAIKPDGVVLRVQGRPTQQGGYIMTYTDVTALKQSELAYRDQATRLALILDNVVDAIITINESGSIESWSNGAERLFGYKAEEVLRRNVKILMPDPHASAHEGYLRRYLQTGEQHIVGTRREVEAQHQDGRRVPVDLAISEMRIGKRRLFIGIVRDISERIEVERLKSGFVSTVSHELRTPLTSISGSLGLLAGGVAGELPPKARRLIDIAKLNSERLVRLINDILDLEKAESGRLDFRLELQNVKDIVQHAIDLNRAYAQGFGVAIELDPLSKDAHVLVDHDRFVQVLTNLISNAAKFSPRGGTIRLASRVEHDNVLISVSDQGPGIAEEFQKRIFQKFAQADSSDSRAKGGTGLGLSIAKTIVERLGGSITFKSKLGQGATFSVNLPLRHQHAPLQSGGTGFYAGCSVLVCEDDPDVAALLVEILRSEGMRAETVASARAARAALDAVRFDAAIVDLHLPDADGLEFITELRSRAGTSSLPVIVVTALARGTSGESILSTLQLADWLQKPIDPQRLLDAIRNALTQPRDGRARILHVEDDVSLTHLVRELLGDEADLVAANSLAQARRRVADASYDLVILDIALGDGSGLDILPLLNRDGHSTPVILYSATEASREVAGMVQAALVKSRDSVEHLLASVRSLARRNG